MTPYYQTELGKLYHGDCLEIMPHLEPVDLVLTDPPYGINFKYESHNDSPNGYGEWIWKCIEQAEGKVVDGGMILVYQAMKNIRYLHKWFPREWRLFIAIRNFIQMMPCAMQYAVDPCVVWWKGSKKPYSRGTSSRDFHIGNTSPSSYRKGIRNAKGHPCPRPLDQIEHIIYQWSPDNSIILDPFLGSGTTAIACERLNRRWIGIEIEEKYCEIAAKRIEMERSQLKLW